LLLLFNKWRYYGLGQVEYKKEEQIIAENSRQALYVVRSLQSFINAAYKVVENISFNSDVISIQKYTN
jgi:hypothetical protein